jgi:hypothetical protein
MNAMNRKWVIGIVGGLLVAGGVYASHLQVPVAKCRFTGYEPKGSIVLCRAIAEICIEDGSEPDPQHCRQELELDCNGEVTFLGAWEQESQQNPERFFIRGQSSESFPNPPVIVIKPEAGNATASSVLELKDSSIEGECELMFPTMSLRSHWRFR